MSYIIVLPFREYRDVHLFEHALDERSGKNFRIRETGGRNL